MSFQGSIDGRERAGSMESKLHENEKLCADLTVTVRKGEILLLKVCRCLWFISLLLYESGSEGYDICYLVSALGNRMNPCKR